MKRRELSRPARALVVLVWAMTAVLAGTVTSWAVSVIGSEEGAPKARVLSEADVAAALQQQVAAPAASATPTPDVPSESPSATAKPTHKPTATPTAMSEQTTAPSSATVERIFNLTGGQVDAFCTGAAFTMSTAPLDGWTMHVDRNGPVSGEVTFHRDGTESRLRATCSGGVPIQGSNGGGD